MAILAVIELIPEKRRARSTWNARRAKDIANGRAGSPMRIRQTAGPLWASAAPS